MSTRKPPDLILSKDTPAKTADEYLQRYRPQLLNQQEQFLDYKDGARYPVEDATIRAEIASMMEGAKRIPRALGAGTSATKLSPVPFNPKSADISDVYRLVIDKTHKAADAFAPPCWLDGRSGPDPKNIICVENGLLDIATRELFDHTPAFFTRNRIPCKYDEAAPESARWLTFLTEITDNRPQLVTLLQEMIGYKLSPDVSQQRIFLYAGLQGAGKGTLMTVERLLQSASAISPTRI